MKTAINTMLREFEEASILIDARQAIAGTPCNGAVGYSPEEVDQLSMKLAGLFWRWLAPWMMETEPDDEMLVASAQFLAEAVLQPAFARKVTEARGGAIPLPGIVGATQSLRIRGEVEDGDLIVHGVLVDDWPQEIAFAGNLYRLERVDADPALPEAEYRKKAYSRAFAGQ